MKRWPVWGPARACRVSESREAVTSKAYMAWRKAGRRSGVDRRRFRPQRFLKALAWAKHGTRRSCGKQGRLKGMKPGTSFRVANTIRAESSSDHLTLILVEIRVGEEPKNVTAKIPISTAQWWSLS